MTLELYAPEPAPVVSITPQGLGYRVLAEVARRRGLHLWQIKSPLQYPKFVDARQVAMYILYCRVGIRGRKRVARYFKSNSPNGKNHTTVLHSTRKIERLTEADLHLAAEIDDICRDLGI